MYEFALYEIKSNSSSLVQVINDIFQTAISRRRRRDEFSKLERDIG